ncbi:MAG TPA: methyltransferase, partial [Caulobacteraceae bacterium]|nr:methyltransferase [Caulobacteraceae bacterium]
TTAISEVPGYVAAAVSDPARPADQVARDAARKPAVVMAFSRIKPGDKVLELIPGHGYFTRVIAKVVGPTGHDYTAIPQIQGFDVSRLSSGLAGAPGYANVSEIPLTPEGLRSAGPVDAIWISQNYHDLHLPMFHADVMALDKLFYETLKPGGVLLIEDHAAVAGSGLRDNNLHRIDEAVVKQELESVGFKLEAESDILRNPADPHTAAVFDPSIRGHTDQFLLLFKKPR